MRQLALGWLTAADAGHVGLVEAAAAAGFGAVSLKLLPAVSDPVPPVLGDLAMVRAIRRALAETGVALLEMGGVWLRPETDIRSLDPGLDLGAELGARSVVVVGGDPDRTRLEDRLAALCAAAVSRGLGVAIEFVAYSDISTIEDAAALAERTGYDACGVLVDALHLHRSGGSATAMRAIRPERIVIGQICDAPNERPASREAERIEARSQRLNPGDGGLPLRAFLAALPEDVPLELEIPRADLSHLPPRERIMHIAQATRRFLAT